MWSAPPVDILNTVEAADALPAFESPVYSLFEEPERKCHSVKKTLQGERTPCRYEVGTNDISAGLNMPGNTEIANVSMKTKVLQTVSEFGIVDHTDNTTFTIFC